MRAIKGITESKKIDFFLFPADQIKFLWSGRLKTTRVVVDRSYVITARAPAPGFDGHSCRRSMYY